MKWLKLFCIAFFVIFVITLVGCGDDDSSSSSSTSSSGNVALTGTLLLGSIKNDGIKAMKEASGYTVVVVDNTSNETYSTTSNSAGEFSLEVPSGSTYLVSLVNDGSYIGPTVFNDLGSEANTAIAPSSDTDLSLITVDTTYGYAKTWSKPDSVDTSVTCAATDGVPIGADDCGKTENSGITNRTDSDEDLDGIPNIFDADEDNDGIRDGVASMPSSSDVVSDIVETVFMSSNIWADHGTTSNAEDLIAMRLHVIPKTGQESLISSVQCVDVPLSIASIATIRWADSLGNPTGYPTENSLWQASGYGLYKTTTLSPEEWIVSITPKAVMSVGDTFTIRVTYTDASYEDFFITTSYVLTDWARISTYNSTSMPSNEGMSDDPVEYSSDTLEIVFTKPIDEDGNVLAGLSYSLRYAESTYDASAGRYLVPSVVTEDSVTDTGGATLTHTITTTTATTYYVTPVAESADGQRNGEETWFTIQ